MVAKLGLAAFGVAAMLVFAVTEVIRNEYRTRMSLLLMR
jgi:hypothetical protein